MTYSLSLSLSLSHTHTKFSVGGSLPLRTFSNQLDNPFHRPSIESLTQTLIYTSPCGIRNHRLLNICIDSELLNSSMGIESLLPAPVGTDSSFSGVNFTNSLLDDASMKVRKPYTITKSRQNWTDIEHDKFLESLQLFDRDWKKIEAFVGSKTAIQIRSHAQKYFLKVQKSGTNEHVPPPRPKRKATHPYPHKAPKNDAPKVGGVPLLTADFIKHEDILIRDSYLWPTNPCTTAPLSSWTYNAIGPPDIPTQDDVRSSGAAISHNCCSSSIDSGPGIRPVGETNNQEEVKHRMTGRVLPDFPKVYRFIGGIFDPNESDHLQKMKMMDPVDVETVVLLMKNLCANLKSPQFDDYRRLFSWYDAGTEKVATSGSLSGLQAPTASS